MPTLPKIKVCGVTQPAQLEHLAQAGVDTVGINLVDASPRSVSVDLAGRLSQQAERLGLLRVIVVMDLPASRLAAIAQQVPSDYVQLHGSESPGDLSASDVSLPIIKALSWTGREEEQELAVQWSEQQQLAAWLVDAYAPGQGGGSGKVARWDILQPRPTLLSGHPLILAGGLKPENVGEAIRVACPEGVDTASGVETSPGVKAPDRISAFAAAARDGFGDMQR